GTVHGSPRRPAAGGTPQVRGTGAARDCRGTDSRGDEAGAGTRGRPAGTDQRGRSAGAFREGKCRHQAGSSAADGSDERNHARVAWARARNVPAMKLRSGFTTTELLVTLAIISVLAAIAYPAGRSVVRHAHKAACLSNLRQIG